MAGDLVLGNGLIEVTKSMLKGVCSILDNLEIPYFVDNGTLLGIIRENRILPWDNDADISVDSKVAEKIYRNRWRFWLKGYRTFVRRYKFDTEHFKKGELRIIKIQTKKGPFIKEHDILDIFIKKKVDDIYLWTVGAKDIVVQTSPAKYYENLKRITFDDYDYLVPESCENYLEYRYGDWKTPVKEWDWRVDDKSITI